MSEAVKVPTYHCEACGAALTREEYVAVGSTSPAARHLGIADSTRDHLVACDECFDGAVEEIAQRGESDD